ncbi:YegP family protein [Desulfomicrobium baculatum]|uniref:DUF1508 domain-containing protein n=1 Tax=Desulfomicrobium baculatum (strain DSM 4028 / VKM B-1378 / X) TaxID=525897 RepID=C7LND5_DESBD|nr:YegP family protein [Desulfomicrobium baculatum]ACU90104.1 protein of unknown function DUF1508 [Desulfomicrobium baculatum DSM 4028]
MSGKFEMYKDKAGEFRFRLKAGNGQIILASEGYKDKSGCKNGIESVKKNAVDEGRFKKIDTKSGKYAFSLLAANHQVIGASQQYESVASRDNGIQSVMTNASEAAVVEVEA